jgi:hypothetical protein
MTVDPERMAEAVVAADTEGIPLQNAQEGMPVIVALEANRPELHMHLHMAVPSRNLRYPVYQVHCSTPLGMDAHPQTEREALEAEKMMMNGSMKVNEGHALWC